MAIETKDLQSFGGNHRCNSAENSEWCKIHYIANHFKDHVRNGLKPFNDRTRIIANSSACYTKKNTEDHDLQNLIIGHRFKNTFGKYMFHKIDQRENFVSCPIRSLRS